MTIAPGEALPDVTFRRLGPDGAEVLSTDDLFAGRKVAMFGVPGAFTPTCHNRHVPSFLEKAAEFRARGVEEIVCISVNDTFVMDAWAKATGAGEAILFVSDWNADFARATGLDLDRGATLGVRSQRFSMLVEDGIVRAINVDDVPGQFEKTNADTLLKAL